MAVSAASEYLSAIWSGVPPISPELGFHFRLGGAVVWSLSARRDVEFGIPPIDRTHKGSIESMGVMIFVAAARRKHGGIAWRTQGLEDRAARPSAGGQMWKLPQDGGFGHVQFPAARRQNGFVNLAHVHGNVLDPSIEPTRCAWRNAQGGLLQPRPHIGGILYCGAVEDEVGDPDIFAVKDRVCQIVVLMYRRSFDVRETVDGQCGRHAGKTTSVLRDVRELMGKETLSERSGRIIHAGAEIDVITVPECQRAELPTDLSRFGITVNAHTREVLPERLLHAPTDHRSKRLSLGLPADQSSCDRRQRTRDRPHYRGVRSAKNGAVRRNQFRLLVLAPHACVLDPLRDHRNCAIESVSRGADLWPAEISDQPAAGRIGFEPSDLRLYQPLYRAISNRVLQAQHGICLIGHRRARRMRPSQTLRKSLVSSDRDVCEDQHSLLSLRSS